jgi:hypothetical protein
MPIQVEETSKTLNRHDQNKTIICSLQHTIVKTLSTENKERILKYEREKYQDTYKSESTRITANCWTETLKARWAWNEVFQALKENNFKLKLLYPAKLSFIVEREIKAFHDKQKLKQFLATKPALQKISKRILHTEGEDKCSHESMKINKSH